MMQWCMSPVFKIHFVFFISYCLTRSNCFYLFTKILWLILDPTYSYTSDFLHLVLHMTAYFIVYKIGKAVRNRNSYNCHLKLVGIGISYIGLKYIWTFHNPTRKLRSQLKVLMPHPHPQCEWIGWFSPNCHLSKKICNK